MVALSSHRKVLKKNVERTRQLIKTIDKTIEHLQGTKKMKETEFYHGFGKEKQAEYEKQLIERFGDRVKVTIAESHKRVKQWTKSDWDRSNKEFDAICKELTERLRQNHATNSKEVQELIRRHCQWMSQFWTPDQKGYTIHSQLIIDSDLRQAYEAYDSQLPEFIAKAIQEFAERELI
jgi:hypothetical protein